MGIQLDHSVFCAGLEFGFDEVDFIFPNKIRDGWGVDHDFKTGNASAARLAHKNLRDDGDDGGGELGSDRLFSVGGKGIYDSGDGPGSSRCVEGSKDQVAGFGGGDGSFDRLEVAHLADKDDIWILTKGAPDGFGKAGNVHVDFALGDDAFFVGMIVLDGVLDRDDVGLPGLVDPVDHRGKGGRLTRSGGAGDEDQAAGAGQQILNRGGKADLIHRKKAARDEAEDESIITFGLENTDAKARAVSKRDGEIGASLPLQTIVHMRRQNGTGDLPGMFGSEGRAVVGGHFPRYAEHGGLTHLKMEIGGATFHDGGQEFVDVGGWGAHIG